MKKIIFAIAILLISAMLLLPIAATETEVAEATTPAESTAEETTPEDTTPAESAAEETTPEDTLAEAPVETVLDTPAETPEDTTASGERVIPIDEFLLRMWDEYRDTIFAALSTVFSMIIALFFKNRFVPSVRALVGSQDKKLDAIAEANDKFIETTNAKLQTFADYNKISEEMKELIAGAQLDRDVLIKVIELQASQVNKLIEFSNLPQARKDQIYEGYRAQLCEIERLKGGGSDEA